MEFITVCLSEVDLFTLAFEAAIEFVYSFQYFAGMIDPNGASITFTWDEVGQCYWTDELPLPSEPT